MSAYKYLFLLFQLLYPPFCQPKQLITLSAKLKTNTLTVKSVHACQATSSSMAYVHHVLQTVPGTINNASAKVAFYYQTDFVTQMPIQTLLDKKLSTALQTLSITG
jgi:hypothetical protein